MKICPTCRKTYQDDNLNFCLEDGAVLTMASDDPPATVMMGQPRPTDPSPGFGALPSQQGAVRSSFGNEGAYVQPTKKSSKTWLWVLGIAGILLLLCGGGGVVGLILLASQGDRAANNSGPTPPANKELHFPENHLQPARRHHLPQATSKRST